MPLIRSITVRAWSLVLLSAVLQVFLFPTGGPISPIRCALGWFALVPFLVALLLADRAGRPLGAAQAALLGYACGIVWYLGNCYWIYQTMYLYGGMAKPIAFGILILFSLYLGLYHGLFAVCFVRLRRGRIGVGGALLLMPFVWVAVELARGRITGFPWDLLGYSQVDNLLLTRIAPLGGVMAMSFVIAAMNAGLAGYFLLRGRKRVWIAGLAAMLAILLQAGGLVGRRQPAEATARTAILMQENIAVGALAKEVEPMSAEKELQVFSQMSVHAQAEGAVGATAHPAVVIWPEAPAHFFSYDANFRRAIGGLARSLEVPAIIGSLGVDFSKQAARGYFVYDSASLFDSAGNYQGRYDKVHLVPWGEYVPYKEFFGFAGKLTEGSGDMDRGARRTVFSSDGHTYGVFVCYESIFGDEVREFAKNGAEVLVNISDDGWYGDTGAPWQHLNMARMRAIENRRWVLRSTNTGVTTAIDPYGRMAGEAPRHVRGAYGFGFGFREGTTFYTRHGDWFAWMCAGVAVAGLVGAGFAVRRDKRDVVGDPVN